MPDRDATEARAPQGKPANSPATTRKSTRKRRAQEPHTASPRVGFWGYATVIILVLAVFSPLLNSELLWSEYDTVERSAYQSMPNWQAAWSLESVRHNDPLSISSYFLEQAIPLPRSTVHHGINILLHLIAAILLLKSLQALQLSAALSATLVFALHPATIQTLFWSGYRTEIIGLIMVLTALYFGIRNRNAGDYAATLLFSTIGCLIHPAAYAIPLILALVIFYQQRKAKLRDFNRVLPLVCLSLFLSAWAGGNADTTGAESLNPLSYIERFNQAAQNMSFFTRQTLLPVDSGLFHSLKPTTDSSSAGEIQLAPFVVYLLLLGLIACNIRKTWSRALLLGLGSYLLLILYGVSQNGQFIDGSQAHETHRLYVALPFLLALIVVGLGNRVQQIKGFGKPLWIAGISVLLLVQMTLTASFAQHIADADRMWQVIAERWPQTWQPRAALVDNAQHAEQPILNPAQVIEHLEFILEQRPDLLDKRLLLARTFHAQRQNSNAAREYKRLLRETQQPGNDLLEEAARFFDTVGLRWEAANARQRVSGE